MGRNKSMPLFFCQKVSAMQKSLLEPEMQRRSYPYHTCIYMCKCMCVWKLEVHINVFFEARSLTEPGARQYRSADWWFLACFNLPSGVPDTHHFCFIRGCWRSECSFPHLCNSHVVSCVTFPVPPQIPFFWPNQKKLKGIKERRKVYRHIEKRLYFTVRTLPSLSKLQQTFMSLPSFLLTHLWLSLQKVVQF